jgi:hypothetical protein
MNKLESEPLVRCASSAKRRGIAALAALVLSVAAPLAANALPVIPGANSFGTDTPAGRGGTVYRVTTLAESGAGSLKACVDASGPRVCVFEVSGTIKLSSDLMIRNPNLTIAGQTAPSPGIMLRGAGIWIKASDVLIQHLRVRVGDDPGGPAFENRDALKIDNPDKPFKNVVIDHCSFSWSIDELGSTWKGWNDVSLLNNIFAEPLHDSNHPKGPHGYGIVLGPEDGSAAMIGNLMAHTVARTPLTTATRAVVVNNVVYNWGNLAVDLQSQSGAVTQNTIVGNVFIRGADYTSDPPIVIRAGTNKPPAGSTIYLEDNVAQEATSDPWSIVSAKGGSLNLDSYKVETPQVWPSGMLRMGTGEDATLDHVLSYAGARPADRDAVDSRVVEDVRSRKGRVINCVAPNGTARCERNGGGWPQLAENSRPLTLPENPNGVTDSGYTNLEVWLQQMAAEVEGRSSNAPSAPVLRTQTQ